MPDFVHGSRIHKTLAASLLVAGVVGSASCAHKVPRAFNPPPVAAKAPEPLPEPAEIALLEAVSFEPALYDFPRQTDPSGRLPEMPKPRPPKPPVATLPKPTPPPPDTPPPAAAPKLAQILTPEESRRNTQELEQYTERVKRALATVAGKSLTADQKDTAELVRTFLLQAEQAREKDLVTAVNLARRADLLAKDLLERLP